MAAAVESFTHFAQLRACPACTELLAPEAAACPVCGRAVCPPHERWPARLKGFLAAMYVFRRMQPWLTEDTVWRALLVDALTGCTAHHHGLAGRPCADAAYAIALERMAQWVAAGCPLDRDALGALWATWDPTAGAPNPFPSYPRPTRREEA